MKILCFGSLNIDHVYRVNHIVRPGETISCENLTDFGGGKGLNQSVALARAGASVWHAGKVGFDGNILLHQLRDAGVNVDQVRMDTSIPSGHAIIQVDENGQNSIVIAGGANTAVMQKDVDEFLKPFEAGDVLLVQNETSMVEYAISAAHDRGMRVALNPSPMDNRLKESKALGFVDWFVLNEIEGRQLTGETDSQAICMVLRHYYPQAKVMLTLGAEGCIYYDGGNFYRHGIYKVQAVDTTAAGDTFTGYFLAGIAEGLPIPWLITLATKASAIAVSRAGASASIPTRKEVEGWNVEA